MNAIEIRNICKRYGDFELRDVSFVLPQGCILGLVGENGAGKSTLIRLMLGACRPDSGEILTLGEKAGRDAAFTEVKQDIGVVLDEACLPDELNAVQIGRMMAALYKNWNQAAFDGYMNRFSLPEKKLVKSYSRGMKMQLALAAALSHGANLLILDEATGGLDPVVRDEILDILNEYTRDETRSVLLSSHIVSDLEKICDYIVFLSRGRVLLVEEKDAIAAKYAMLTLSEAEYAQLDKASVLKVMRAHGAVRVLAWKSMIGGRTCERATIEDVMLLLEKGEGIA